MLVAIRRCNLVLWMLLEEPGFDINVMVIGHSMGGPMAYFCGLDIMVKKVCDGSGEDPICSRLVTGNSLTDHLLYYGAKLMAETWGTCKIVMDPRFKEYGSEDKGYLMLSRNPSSSALRLR
ncbi:uncharacterized protein LOC130137910 [Syzygium oleosum]|uniref:uncharacterized protein LOC130137910 n=1 Tax=Syzygium oleosum TaxID=219896 RepID=UPI0024B991D1|nr:uncharacterized protein LOC130137910 [Syzygium oleosum]